MADNLLGKSHKQYVQDQIKIRQEILGKGDRDNKALTWMNSKTSWVRLASSIDIVNTTTRQKVVVGTTTTTTTTTQTTDQGNIERTTSTTSEIAQEQDVVDTINGTPVGEERLKRLGLDDSYLGDVLANNLVLHGGVGKRPIKFNDEGEAIGYENTLSKKSGIASSLENFVDSTNSYSSRNGDFGLVAMPGIESVDIKSKSMGSLREASISLRINDAEQLELLEAIYLKIGYSVFLEWGNSHYYKHNNDGDPTFVKGVDADPGLLFDFLSPPDDLKNCPTSIVARIEKAREKSQGNYDALFGRIKNFSWEFNPSGFYTATLDVISWGDIIESIGIDGFYPDVYTTKLSESEDNNEASESSTIEKKDESLLNTFIYEASLPSVSKVTSTFVDQDTGFRTNIDNFDYQPVRKTLRGDTSSKQKVIGSAIPAATMETKTEFESRESDYSDPLKYNREKTNSKGRVIQGTAVFASNKALSYIRLGDILDFIKDRLLIYTDSTCDTPIIDINTDTNSNYCYNPGVNVSADPTKVMINARIPILNKDLNTLATLKNRKWEGTNPEKGDNEVKRSIFGFDKAKTFQEKDVKLERFTHDVILSEGKEIANVTVGLIMNIYFEKEFLYSTIDQHRDKKTGQLSLYKFIKSLLDEANSCLGGVNKLDLRVVNDQTLEIYDQVPLYDWKKGEPLPQEFNIFGLKPKKDSRDGSFVTNFGLKTELTNEFATITSIGAQANGSVVGEDSTFLSKWNFGLVDRFYPTKIDSLRRDNPSLSPEEQEQKEYDALLVKMFELWSDYSIQSSNLLEVDKSEGIGALGADITDGYAFPYFRLDSVNSYVKIQKEYLKALIKLKTKQENILSNQIGMLPINLNLEMDGISGIRIYDQIRVNTRFLPSYYPRYLMFIIKGVSHAFSGNRWVTKIDTIAQPKVQFGSGPDYIEATEVDLEDIIQEDADERLDGLIDVTPTLDSSAKRTIIDAYGWPTKITEINGKYYANISSKDSAGRNVYQRDSTWVNENTETFTYNFGNGKIVTVPTVHKDLVEPLTSVLDRIKSKNLQDGVSKLDCSVYVRDVTGKENVGSLSGHSFGLAIDVNAGEYPYGEAGYNKYLKDLSNKVPTALVVQEFTFSSKFNWGGYYTNTKDAHHFSLSIINDKRIDPI